MYCTLFFIGLVLFSTLYFLSDTITEALSGGKSFMPREMKNYSIPPKVVLLNSYSKRRDILKSKGFSFDRQSGKITVEKTKEQIESDRLFHLFLDNLRNILILWILFEVGYFIFKQLNF